MTVEYVLTIIMVALAVVVLLSRANESMENYFNRAKDIIVEGEE
jgi:hypothetical protein